MRELINNVIQWASDRNILEGSTALKQLDKTSEEFNELQRAAGAHEYVMSVDGYPDLDVLKELEDAYGDVLVTLIIASQMHGISLEDALATAWNTIKDRKGRLVNGKFVKEEDL